MAIKSDDLRRRFPWGRVIEDYEFGPYAVRAFHPYKLDNGRSARVFDPDLIHYHGFIDGEDCNESWLSLDEALAGMIVRRNVGPNCRQINEHFMAGLRAMSANK